MAASVLGFLGYTLLLLLLGRLGFAHNRRASGFLTAHRRLQGWHVFILTTSLWTSWLYVTEVDEAYQVGLSAVWFGVALAVMSVVIAFVFIRPFRRLGFLTNSELLGRAYGPWARLFSGVIIGCTFPIFALGNILGAAALLKALLGWPLLLTESATLALIVAYITFGGILSLAYTQAVNLVFMGGGLLVVALAAFLQKGLPVHVAPLAYHGSDPFAWFGLGAAPILVWFVSDLVNSVTAQAEFQAVTAVEKPATAQRAVLWSTGLLLTFALAAAYLGIVTRLTLPTTTSGVLAYPALLLHHLPPWVGWIGAFSVWASALTWGAPLLFSGASSLGLDVAAPLLGRRGDEDVRFLIRLALPLQALLVLFYTALRPGDLAWWSVFALTVRNGAIFAPTIGLLLWDLGGRRAAVAAMLFGMGSGLLWNALTGFSPNHFALATNPAWIGTSVSILVFLFGSLWEARTHLAWLRPTRPLAWLSYGWCIVSLGVLFSFFPIFEKAALVGPLALSAIVALFLGVITTTRPAVAVSLRLNEGVVES